MAEEKLGKRAAWSVMYASDRPRDVLKLSETQEATLKQFIGFSAMNQNGDAVDQFILTTDETSVDLTDYPDVPIGTIILTPKVSGVAFDQRIAQATAGASVNADWNKVAKVAV